MAAASLLGRRLFPAFAGLSGSAKAGTWLWWAGSLPLDVRA